MFCYSVCLGVCGKDPLADKADEVRRVLIIPQQQKGDKPIVTNRQMHQSSKYSQANRKTKMHQTLTKHKDVQAVWPRLPGSLVFNTHSRRGASVLREWRENERKTGSRGAESEHMITQNANKGAKCAALLKQCVPDTSTHTQECFNEMKFCSV